mmetsp:Transcript_63577/g.143424  ORF Transcript_63577/g.143424 Transcript_63577/m.143424 type:complete len:221 (+) Transcript_63577:703-1365(+)
MEDEKVAAVGAVAVGDQLDRRARGGKHGSSPLRAVFISPLRFARRPPRPLLVLLVPLLVPGHGWARREVAHHGVHHRRAPAKGSAKHVRLAGHHRITRLVGERNGVLIRGPVGRRRRHMQWEPAGLVKVVHRILGRGRGHVRRELRRQDLLLVLLLVRRGRDRACGRSRAVFTVPGGVLGPFRGFLGKAQVFGVFGGCVWRNFFTAHRPLHEARRIFPPP